MHLIFLLYSVLWLPVSVFENREADEIRWSQKSELDYSDFKGAVPGNTPWAALTTSYIYFTYSTSNGKISTFKVYASFKKNESWMKTARADVLAHEQLHFAITEYFARKLYSDAQQLKSQSGNVAASANALFNAVNKECDQMQETYDDETEHGVDIAKQEKWRMRVAGLMKQYDPYPETVE
jgi:hypothetical protein